MAMPLEMVKDGLSYLRANPLFLVRAARNAARLRLGIPIDALRWLVEHRPKGGKGPESIELYAAPPALGVGATVDLFGTKLGISSSIEIDSIDANEDALRVVLRVRDLKVDAPKGSPAAMMLGSMDLSKPGNLMGMMPQKPPALVEASGDRFVLDLLKVPKLAANKGLKRLLALVADVIVIKDVRTEGDMLVVGFKVNARALPLALARLRASN